MDTTQRSSMHNGIGPLHTNIPRSPTARARNVGLWPPPLKIQKLINVEAPQIKLSTHTQTDAITDLLETELGIHTHTHAQTQLPWDR